MKDLFLDKYFFPFGKGFGVKLFRVEELTDKSKDFIDELSWNIKPQKSRRNKKDVLDALLFD